MKNKLRVGFIGVGNMGSALIQGGLEAGVIQAGKVVAYDIDRKRLNQVAAKNKIKKASSNGAAIQGSDFVFVCVKPQQLKEFIEEVKEEVSPKQCFISIAAGIRTRTIENYFSGSVPVIRAMPNTPALIQSGMSVVTKGRFANNYHLNFAVTFFSSIGKTAVLAEKHFDAVTAISGSGPAYLFYLAEALGRAGEKLGLPKSTAELLSKQTLFGSGKMLGNADTPSELRKRVTSPGGTTESAIRYLEENRWSDIFERAIRKAKDRSEELSTINK